MRKTAVVALAVIGVLLLAAMTVLRLMVPATQRGRDAARRLACGSNLKLIGLALQAYQNDWGCFPAAYLADELGRPSHSWRVLILPYLEQQTLYARYRFDEPWDGPNNRLLTGSMPLFYRCPADVDARDSATSYLAVSGPGTAFNGAEATSRDQFLDGLQNTLLVVEVAGANLNWMEPRDLDAVAPGPAGAATYRELSSYHPHEVMALFANGSVRAIDIGTDPSIVQALATIAGHEAEGTVAAIDDERGD